jgi:hypothetical protein
MNLTLAVYGAIKSGKTHFAATAPRPVFIAAAPERGWSALPSHSNWPNITVLPLPLIKGLETISGDPNVKTPDYALVKDNKPRNVIADLEYIIFRRIREQYEENNWRTVVIDTTTLLGEMFVSCLSNYGEVEMGGRGGGQWTKVKQLFNNIVNSLQSLPLHVIWTFHEATEKNGDFIVKHMPALVGSNWDRAVAPTCRVIARLVKTDEQNPETGEIHTQRALYTKCPTAIRPPFEAGSNFEHLLPEGCYVPSWDTLLKPERLGSIIRAD